MNGRCVVKGGCNMSREDKNKAVKAIMSVGEPENEKRRLIKHIFWI
jgi:hypothetical protein